MNATAPKAFISYAWESDELKLWVKDLAARLRSDGVDVHLDQWVVAPGDQLPLFMEAAIRDNDFVVIVCTPRYKQKSESRLGGVGYEGDIMTAEVLKSRNHRKFIPILRQMPIDSATPSWLSGKYAIDLSGDPYQEEHYQDLLTTLLGIREKAPPLGTRASRPVASKPATPPAQQPSSNDGFDPINILGVVVDEVTQPRNDGTAGCALYKIPFRLSRRPPEAWSVAFERCWKSPPQYTLMHRPSIARVVDDKIVLDGTTLEEVEKYHRATLKLCVQRANQALAQHIYEERVAVEDERRRKDEHLQRIADAANRLNFD